MMKRDLRIKNYSKNEKLFFDTECYPNYFLIIFSNETGKTVSFEKTETKSLNISRLKEIIRNRLLIGFNSKMYDIPMISYAMQGVSNSALKNMSNLLIPDKERVKEGHAKSSYSIISNYSLWQLGDDIIYDHIDVMNVAPGKCSLKLYGARIGTAKLQDLPYNHMENLTFAQMKDVKEYCINDVKITTDLYNVLADEFAVRENLNKEFEIDSRSKSDAQIADLVIGKFCTFDANKLEDEIKFKFKSNLNFKFKSQDLINLKSDLNNIEFQAKRYSKIKCDDIYRKIIINDVTYNFGMGGLHSNETKRSLIADNDEWFIDIDVSSCYPKIILNNKLCPPQIEEGFLDIYNKFYEERLSVKNTDISKSKILKIVLNGSFGKFGDGYSKYLYAPELLITTTVTGQLGLLLLIERLEEHGYNVLSANTDGIIVKVRKKTYKSFRKIISAWENKFNYSTSEVKYKALYNHSVNSYIAIKEDGSLKTKGLFAENDLSKNIDVPICKKAVVNYVTKGISIENSIYNCNLDPMDLIKIRKTKYGAYWQGAYLGHTVRWYWATNGESITNSKGHKIAETADAYPLMNLNESIKNLHYDKYIKKSYELLNLIGLS